jgi:hypothetical protein
MGESLRLSGPTSLSRHFEPAVGKLEARVGIEPTHKGFADLSLTTWVPRLNLSIIAKTLLTRKRGFPSLPSPHSVSNLLFLRRLF